MRVNTKGQVTIPAAIRQQFGFVAGSEVDFVLDETQGRVYLVPRKPTATTTTNRFAHLRGIATIPMLTDDIMALTRGDE
jgi:AbrB family looped-hinge helix DNA binding protein